MKYQIKIDLKSIELNPDYPQPAPVYSGSNMFMNITYYPKNVGEQPPEEIDKIRLVSFKQNFIRIDCVYAGTIPKDFCLDRFKRKLIKIGLKIISFTINHNFNEIRTIFTPPKYLYKYKPKKVKCYKCKSVFFHTKLRNKYVDWYDEDGEENGCWIENVCPNCKEEDCCELKFEKLDFKNIELKRTLK